MNINKTKLCTAIGLAAMGCLPGWAATEVTRLNPSAVEVRFDGDSTSMLVDFYGPNIFRLFQDPSGGIARDPQADPPAKILVGAPRRSVGEIVVKKEAEGPSVTTSRVKLQFKNDSRLFTVTDLATGKETVRMLAPVDYNGKRTAVKLAGRPGEYFYGGGVQNGRFSHKGKSIDIVNTNSWTDGGVASPTPFYWSTDGYGVMWHTFAPGAYDFGATESGAVKLTHETPYLDVFMMVDEQPVALLNDFYQLTGNPVLLPKFGFYEGHLNAYNRDYWTVDSTKTGILFEDGKYYKESQKNNGGIRESLNGEKPGNYQFSARAVIDRYNRHDMPLGWVLPNDGYGAGYGQTSTLDGNVQNLKDFGDYAREKGVEIGLWTQSDLHPKAGIEPLLQRDIVKEVRDAGVRVLKTDVAWVGAGYSFGLNGVADVGEIMPYYGNDARPFIISLDGWAGTQRYATIWSGDQTGGEWEYIRFHIPTYIGSGLSGQPNICSDMDGIFGGQNIPVNIRDFQWKTFTPMQLNMDGWGRNPKYPMALGKDAERINRAYLKLKSELLPYAYTYAREAVDGKPLMRAMFVDYPNDFTHGTATRYQFLYGPDLLVAPIYQATRSDAAGNDVRNNIYLPEGRWFDYFSGREYNSDGAKVINNYGAPLWKLPVLVKAGAIIPMVNPNNNPSQINRNLRIYEFWPEGSSEMTEYDDDGTTMGWQRGESATTRVTSSVNAKGVLSIEIDPTKGTFSGMTAEKATELRINATAKPKSVTATVGGKKVKLTEAASLKEFKEGSNVWFFNENANRLRDLGVEEAEGSLPQILVSIARTDVSANAIGVEVKGFELNPQVAEPAMTAITAPSAPEAALADGDVQPYSLTVRWKPINDASSVEILHDGILYTNLGTAEGENSFLFDELTPETSYDFKLRAVNSAGTSDWTDLTVKTADNPLEFAISGITATNTAADQPGFDIERLFDFAERGDIWHTSYRGGAIPFDMTIDLGSFNTLDRMEYLPRQNAGNGTLLEGTVAFSENGKDWSEPVAFKWARNGDTKTFKFEGSPLARFIRLHVDKAVGNYGSGRELYVFRQPGSPVFIPGDVNKDNKIDENDLTSYTNYTGLRRGDSDFDYVSMGDVNRNGLIDAYDISTVTTRLGGGIENASATDSISGTLNVAADKAMYNAGDVATLTVSSDAALKGLNGFSFALVYDPEKFEYIGAEPQAAVSGMENLTYDRLHTSGVKSLYPTFVTIGDKPAVNGAHELVKLKFKARKRGKIPVAPTDMILVDKALRTR